MGFELVISKKAVKDLERMDFTIAARIVKKLRWFSQQKEIEPFIVIMKERASGDVRFRIGDYRAIGVWNQFQTGVTIVAIGHRREIYRG